MSGSNGFARVATGIVGLDEMLGGGLPAGHVVLVTGLPGTGKTCFGLQFLFAGLARGEKGLFLSLEEDAQALTDSARQFGWPVDAAIEKQTLRFFRLDPKETDRNLRRIQSELPKELASFGVQRIVVDSVSLLNMLSDNDTDRRNILFTLAAACRSAGSTTVFTAEANPLHPETTRDGLSEYVADGVILLGYSAAQDGHRVGLALRILKMRRTAHSRTVQPYQIMDSGIQVDAKAVDFGRAF
jgi:KaiC domain protein